MAAEQPDLNKEGSINVYMRTAAGELVKGGTLEVYKVAYIYSSKLGSKYLYMSEFEGSGYSLENKEIASLASKLSKYASANGIHGDLYENTTGMVTIDKLSPGLYLIENKTAPEGYNTIMPFLVSVPFEVDGTWIYDVDASPKMGLLNQKTIAPDPIPGQGDDNLNIGELENEEDPDVQPGDDSQPSGDPQLNAKLQQKGKFQQLGDLQQIGDLQQLGDKNLVRNIKSPATGDESGNIIAVITGLVLLCIASVVVGVYMVRKKKA